MQLAETHQLARPNRGRRQARYGSQAPSRRLYGTRQVASSQVGKAFPARKPNSLRAHRSPSLTPKSTRAQDHSYFRQPEWSDESALSNVPALTCGRKRGARRTTMQTGNRERGTRRGTPARACRKPVAPGRFNALLAGALAPVTRSSSAVSDRDHEDAVCSRLIDHFIRKSIEQESACPFKMHRPTLWRCSNLSEGAANLELESGGSREIACCVPLGCLACFFGCSRKNVKKYGHSRSPSDPREADQQERPSLRPRRRRRCGGGSRRPTQHRDRNLGRNHPGSR